jgi:hypothetical protein
MGAVGKAVVAQGQFAKWINSRKFTLRPRIENLGHLRLESLTLRRLSNPNQNPKSSGFPWQSLGLIALASLVGYLAIFYGVEHHRRKDGPWLLTFTEVEQSPALIISHPKLGLSNITIQFVGAEVPTNLPQTIQFQHGEVAPLPLPFGTCVFLDTLYLPGTVACEIFGYEIQILPRTLTIDRGEYPWAASQKILLTNRPSATLPPN